MAGSEMKPFATDILCVTQPNRMREQLYYLDPPVTGYRLITKDGLIFYLRHDLGAKNDELFIKGAPACRGSSPQDVQN